MPPVSFTLQANSLPTEPSGDPVVGKICFQMALGSCSPLHGRAKQLTTWWQRKVPFSLQGSQQGEQAADAQKTPNHGWLSGKCQYRQRGGEGARVSDQLPTVL